MLVTIAALASILVVNAGLIGNGQIALARHHDSTFENSGINVQTDTNQGQACDSGTSPISGSCTASSTDTISQAGGVVQSPPSSCRPTMHPTALTLTPNPNTENGLILRGTLIDTCTGLGVPRAFITFTGTGPTLKSSKVLQSVLNKGEEVEIAEGGTDAAGRYDINIDPAQLLNPVNGVPPTPYTVTVQAHFTGQGIAKHPIKIINIEGVGPSNSGIQTVTVGP